MTARTTTRARHDIAHRNRQDEAREPAGQEYLTPAEFAAALSVSIRTVRNWIADGVIRATSVGPRLIRIPDHRAPTRRRADRRAGNHDQIVETDQAVTGAVGRRTPRFERSATAADDTTRVGVRTCSGQVPIRNRGGAAST